MDDQDSPIYPVSLDRWRQFHRDFNKKFPIMVESPCFFPLESRRSVVQSLQGLSEPLPAASVHAPRLNSCLNYQNIWIGLKVFDYYGPLDLLEPGMYGQTCLVVMPKLTWYVFDTIAEAVFWKMKMA